MIHNSVWVAGRWLEVLYIVREMNTLFDYYRLVHLEDGRHALVKFDTYSNMWRGTVFPVQPGDTLFSHEEGIPVGEASWAERKRAELQEMRDKKRPLISKEDLSHLLRTTQLMVGMEGDLDRAGRAGEAEAENEGVCTTPESLNAQHLQES